MTRRSDSSLAALLLTHRLADRPGEPLKSNEFWELVGLVPDPGVLLGLSAAEVEATVGCAPGLATRYAALLDDAGRLAFLLEEMEQGGLQVITAYDDGYPERLQRRLHSAAPAALYVAGALTLLREDGVGVVGSRAASPEAQAAATAVAGLAAASGVATVSGGARGIDQTAMAAARQAGGTVVGVLAESLPGRLNNADTRRAVIDGDLCLLTPYRPSAPFSVGNAMGRNRLIYALSLVTVVVAADHGQGGTWAGATEAISRGHGRVAVWTGPGAGAGNSALVARGGEAVDVIGPGLLVAPPPAPVAEASAAPVVDAPAEQLGMLL